MVLSRLPAALALASLLCAAASAADQRDPVFSPPKKPTPANYSRLWTNSPFTTKVETVQEQGPGFADKLRLEGVMTLDGKDVACLTNTETEDVLYLSQDQPANGISLVSIQNRNQLDQMRVVLASGGQRATVSFDDAQIVVAPAAGSKKPQPPQNGDQSPPPQQRAQQGDEQTKLTQQEMMERRRKFWENMRNRRRRGASPSDGSGGQDGPRR
ncbi:hypothetical protein [Sulfuriroseicoccus oceanibius]|uniref:Uncharacterized protein n=1 Tax=Sulfuriroseicoccus oceanibius TaxID=2707525 RepID=A0A6B3LEU5_9BACT|nr:hypothetical protein [Sulfuriroseicoccus oceanibius]QQL44821.1 hypothetical protein G3M56_013215 [Sulfuriroseicoccus oceanibius]